MRPSGVVFDHVVLDLDGTLVDSAADLAAAANHALHVIGRPALDPHMLVGFVGEGARVLVERALGGAEPERLRPALEAFLSYYAQHLLDATRPFPGIVDALDALAARGVTLSVLTNKPEGMSRTILGGLGLSARFLEVIGGDTLRTRKPDPEGLERLRARAGAPHARTLLVGDSAVDVRTARAGGVPVCGVAWGLAPGQLLATRPDWLVAEPADLVAIVDGRHPS